MIHRYSPRRPFTCRVTLSCDGLVGQGTLLDLSVPGCLIETGLKLKVGQFIQMRFTLSSTHASLWIPLAVIRWINGSKAGVEFIRMSEVDQAKLRRYVGFAESSRLRGRHAWSEQVMWTGISGV